MIGGDSLDALLDLAGIACGNAAARKALVAELKFGHSLVGKSKSPLGRDLRRVVESIAAAKINPEELRKRRARGRPRGALSSAQRRKQDVVDRAVYFWIRFSPRDLSGAPEGRTYEFVEAFHKAATGKCLNVERQFDRAVMPWVDEAKALRTTPPKI